MPIDARYLLYGAVFIGAVLLIEGIYYLVADTREHSKANRRMNMLASGLQPTEVFRTLRRKAPRQIKALGPLGTPILAFEDMMTRAGVTISIRRMLLLMLGLTILVFVALFLALQNSALPSVFATNAACVVLACLIGLGGPVAAVWQMKNRRMKKFGEQLPETLDTLVRGLRAGHPIASAMSLVTKEMPDPMGSEFGLVVDEMTYGLELNQALDNMAERIRHPDFEYVIVAINIQHETGGNLAEVLSNLSSIIRDRFRMFKKITALSAEGRMSAWVLSVLPIITLLFLSLTAPSYYGAVLDDPAFWPVAGVAMAALLLGIYIMYRMVNFRV